MKVLVIGQGGREHAMCWKLKQSKRVTELYCAPGNPGTAAIGENIPIKVDDLEQLVDFAKLKSIDLTVVGPEYPLTLGIVDKFKNAGLRIFGPSKSAARLEGSKTFAKQVMEAAGVPTAEYRSFRDQGAALDYVRLKGAPIVIKADGLAAGKGVFVCNTLEEAEAALPQAFTRFACTDVVVEEFLEGKESSFIAATDGQSIVPFASSKDYKRIRDNDQGPNTGGMGAVSPTPHLSSEQERWVTENVMLPVIRQMSTQGCPFCGFLYAGLMIADSGEIKVLEFNVRLGDPEAQVILRRMESDFFELLMTLSEGTAADLPKQACSDRAAVCLVMASAGYPESSSKGDLINGLEEAAALAEVEVFHAGTDLNEKGRLVTNGGRVLNVTKMADTVAEARAGAYQAADLIAFAGSQIRRDIAG